MQGIPEAAELPPSVVRPQAAALAATIPTAPAQALPTGPNAAPLDLFPQVGVGLAYKWMHGLDTQYQKWLQKAYLTVIDIVILMKWIFVYLSLYLVQYQHINTGVILSRFEGYLIVNRPKWYQNILKYLYPTGIVKI